MLSKNLKKHTLKNPIIFLRRGITLLEALLIISIVAILMGLVLGMVHRVRGTMDRLSCQNNLKQVGLALQQYHHTAESFPPGCSFENGQSSFPFMAWPTRLLPYMGQDDLWEEAVRAYEKDRSFAGPAHRDILGKIQPIFSCPSDGRTGHKAEPKYLNGKVFAGFNSYLGCSGINFSTNDGLLFLDSKVRIADVIDGTSTTLAAGERPPSADQRFGWWYAGLGQSHDGTLDSVLGVREFNRERFSRSCPPGPYRFGNGDIRNQCDSFHYWSLHSGGANFLLCDGSVRFLTYGADNVMEAMATRDSGDIYQLP